MSNSDCFALLYGRNQHNIVKKIFLIEKNRKKLLESKRRDLEDPI